MSWQNPFSQNPRSPRILTKPETIIATRTERLALLPASTIGNENRCSCVLKYFEWLQDLKRVGRLLNAQKFVGPHRQTIREKSKPMGRANTSVDPATFSVARKSCLLWPLLIPR